MEKTLYGIFIRDYEGERFAVCASNYGSFLIFPSEEQARAYVSRAIEENEKLDMYYKEIIVEF